MPVNFTDIAKKAVVIYSKIVRALNNDPAITREATGHIQQLTHEFSCVFIWFACILKSDLCYRWEIITQRSANPFNNKTQGGIKNVARPFTIRDSYFTYMHGNELWIRLPMVFSHHQAAKVLSHSIYRDVNSTYFDVAFA